jgi:hypothetical protein
MNITWGWGENKGENSEVVDDEAALFSFFPFPIHEEGESYFLFISDPDPVQNPDPHLFLSAQLPKHSQG